MQPLPLRPADPAGLQVVQVTDTHIFADPDERFDGVDTLATLRAVLAAVRAGEKPDLVLATGDLADDPDAGAYARLLPELESLGCPVFCLPGNHDDPDLLYRHLNAGNVRTDKVLDSDHWRLVLLDDHLPGSDAGRLPLAELDLLREALAGAGQRNLLIVVHHPPVPVGSSWMDGMMLENGRELLDLISQFPRIRAIIFGHIHQEFDESRDSVRYLGAPSTCVQFMPDVSEYHVDPKPPGYRRLALRPDGTFESSVQRVTIAGSSASGR